MRVTFETFMIVSVHSLWAHKSSRAWRDDKEFKICIAGFEFKSRRASLVRAWDSRGFTRSPDLTKCAFRGIRFPRIQKKKAMNTSVSIREMSSIEKHKNQYQTPLHRIYYKVYDILGSTNVIIVIVFYNCDWYYYYDFFCVGRVGVRWPKLLIPINPFKNSAHKMIFSFVFVLVFYLKFYFSLSILFFLQIHPYVNLCPYILQ